MRMERALALVWTYSVPYPTAIAPPFKERICLKLIWNPNA